MVFKTFNVIIVFISLCVIIQTNCDEVKRRPKRYLRFLENSKYFIRLNSKHNMVPEFRIFAQATGFRINFDTPKRFGRFRHHKVSRRDLYQGLEQLIMQQGFDGKACVLKSLCEASKLAGSQSGILLKLFKKIFTIPSEDNESYSSLGSQECDDLDNQCPLSILNLSRFTDE